VLAHWSIEAIHLLEAEHRRTAERAAVAQPYGKAGDASAP
jgi:hypothetical protein